MTKGLLTAVLSAATVVVGGGLVLWTCFPGVDPMPPAQSEVAARTTAVDAPEDAATLKRAEALKKATRDRGQTAVGDEEIRHLLRDWSRHDPEAALKFAVGPGHGGTDDGFFRASDIAFRAWAEKQPERARAYLEEISDNARLTAKLAPVLLRLYAERSPRIAQDWLRNGFVDDSGDLRPALARELTHILIENGRRADAEAWLAATDVAKSAYALPAVSEYSRELAAKNVEAALAFAETLPRGTICRAIAIQNTLQAWTARDADQSYAWITRLMAREETRPIAQTTNFPAEPDPDPPVAPGAYSSVELDYAISGYVLALGHTSPKAAMEGAMSIEDFALRRKIQEQVSAMAPETRPGTDS